MKLRWLDDAGKEHTRSLLYNHVCKLVECSRIASSESDADSQGEEFFCFGINDTETENRDGKTEVDKFLSDLSRNLDSLRKFPTILKLFLQHNTF